MTARKTTSSVFFTTVSPSNERLSVAAISELHFLSTHVELRANAE